MARSTPRLYVITGGPCSGKSTLIEALAARGYPTIPEAARAVIKEHVGKGMTVEELIGGDFLGFQRKVLTAQLANEGRFVESHAGLVEAAFLDRGIMDNVGYCNEAGKDGSFIKAHATEGRYAKVFFLEQVPYSTDGERVEDETKAKRISEHIFNAYDATTYEVVRVPLMPVEERIDFVLEAAGICQDMGKNSKMATNL